jgi:hypothetical protein
VFRAPDDSQGVAGGAAGAVGDLLAAGDTGRGDDRGGGLGADGGEQPKLAESHGQVVVLGLEAERARHAAAAGVHLGDLGSGNRAQQRHGGSRAGDRLLVTVAVEQDPRARDRAKGQSLAVIARIWLRDRPSMAGVRLRHFGILLVAVAGAGGLTAAVASSARGAPAAGGHRQAAVGESAAVAGPGAPAAGGHL